EPVRTGRSHGVPSAGEWNATVCDLVLPGWVSCRRGVDFVDCPFVTIGIMKLPGLLSRSSQSLPGVTGVARVDRRTGDLLKRIGSGDIVVLDQLDLDRATADALVHAGVAGVVNASPSISGRFPNLGPELLVEAGIPLIDGVGVHALREIRE